MICKGRGFLLAALLISWPVAGPGLLGTDKAEAAQAVASFRVGLRIVPTAATLREVSPSRMVAASSSRPVQEEKGTTAAARSAAVERSVVVQRGETLGAIAARVYGDASRYMEIFAANRDVLASPDEVPAGTRLRLP